MTNAADFQTNLPPSIPTSTDAAAYAIDGLTPSLLVTPTTQADVAAVVAAANAAGAAVVPWGGGTQQALGMPPERYDIALDLRKLDRVVEYESADLTVTIESGMPLLALQTTLSAHGQWLRLDPDLPPEATVGGILATNASGPARLAHGAARDQLIGISFVTPEGELVKAGGRVVKNVAGYDLGKLQIGALGTLGVIVQASFKVAPLPTSVRSASKDGTLQDVMSISSRLLDAGLPLQASILTKRSASSDWSLLARFAGGNAAVDRSMRDFDALADLKLPYGEWIGVQWTALPGNATRQSVPAGPAVVARAAIPTTAAQPVCEAFAAAGAAVTAYPGVAIVYGAWDKAPDAATLTKLRDLCVQHEGALILEHAPIDLKRSVGVWGAPRNDIELMRRVKATLDPNRTLNPGRYIGAI
ncbi:MAG TPA: FAD-binding oxidoreductase [Dehalococcoidia bacterium]|nr:FAD-binding oxidoreductase [Dehalococcoidia bacterium]